jgi:hypothetical protein
MIFLLTNLPLHLPGVLPSPLGVLSGEFVCFGVWGEKKKSRRVGWPPLLRSQHRVTVVR